MIPGDPAAVAAGAAELGRAASSFDTAGDGIAGQGRTVTASWAGGAASAAGAAVGAAGTRAAVGAEVARAAVPVLREYADQLRQAQQEFATAQQSQDAARSTLSLAPAGVPGDAARLDGQQAVDAAAAAMTTATSRAQQADAAAAARIDALTARLAAMDQPGPGDGRLPLDEILRGYQTPRDPGGTYPTVIGPDVTARELALLDAVGLTGSKDALDIKNAAEDRAGTAFGGAGIQHGHADAFRHAYWNAMLSRRFGDRWAGDFTTAHEGAPGNTPGSEAMDLYNNELGRRIARENPDANPDQLAGAIERAINGGQAVVIAPDHQLAYSDQLPPGGTGRDAPGPDLPAGEPADPDTSYGPGGYDPGDAPGGGATYPRGGR